MHSCEQHSPSCQRRYVHECHPAIPHIFQLTYQRITSIRLLLSPCKTKCLSQNFKTTCTETLRIASECSAPHSVKNNFQIGTRSSICGLCFSGTGIVFVPVDILSQEICVFSLIFHEPERNYTFSGYFDVYLLPRYLHHGQCHSFSKHPPLYYFLMLIWFLPYFYKTCRILLPTKSLKNVQNKEKRRSVELFTSISAYFCSERCVREGRKVWEALRQ